MIDLSASDGAWDDISQTIYSAEKDVRVLMLARASLRIIPVFADLHPKAYPRDPRILVFRILLTMIAGEFSVPSVRERHFEAMEESSLWGVLQTFDPGIDSPVRNAISALNSALSELEGTEFSAVDFLISLEMALTKNSEIQSSVSAAGLVSASRTALELDVSKNDNSAPLWPQGKSPKAMSKLWSVFSMQLGQASRVWGFWLEWYQGFLDGKPLDWELQRRVALIDDAIWEAGPEAVADEIEKIRALFELEKRIEELEAERDVVKARQDRLGIGGNNPPADQQIEMEVVETVTMIWADIDALREEAKKDNPVRALVAAIIDRLGMGLKRLLALCGRLGEHVLKVAVGTVVTTGTVSIIKPELLELVIEAAKRWLAVL